MYCDECGAVIEGDAVFCSDCGVRLAADVPAVTEPPSAHSENSLPELVDTAPCEQRAQRGAKSGPEEREAGDRPITIVFDSLKRAAAGGHRWFAGQQLSRVVSAAVVIGIVLGAWLSGEWQSWLLLLLPIQVGAMFPLVRSQKATAVIESWEHWFTAHHLRAQANTGKFTKCFTRPLLRGSIAIWTISRRVTDSHLRAGVRLATFGYFVGLIVGLLVIVGYALVLIVLFLVALIVLFWILAKALGGEAQPSSGGWISRPRESHTREDWFGQPYVEHTDSEGKKVGESRKREDWFGRPYVEHTDSEGKKVAESHQREDWFGQQYVEHTDSEGKKTGESRQREVWFGEPFVEHTDPEGKKTGESHTRTDWLGGKHAEHSYEEDK